MGGMKSSHKTLALWLVLILVFAALFKRYDAPNQPRQEIKLGQLIDAAKDGKIEELTFKSENLITGSFKAGAAPEGNRQFETNADTSQARLFEIFAQAKIAP